MSLLVDVRGEVGPGEVAGIDLGLVGAGIEWRATPTLRLQASALLLGATGSTESGRDRPAGAPAASWRRAWFRFPRGPVRPYLRASGGLLLFLRGPFLPGGDVYDFVLQLGAGLEVPLGERLALFGDLHVVHLSNGQGLGPGNPAFTGEGGLIGAAYALAPPGPAAEPEPVADRRRGAPRLASGRDVRRRRRADDRRDGAGRARSGRPAADPAHAGAHGHRIRGDRFGALRRGGDRSGRPLDVRFGRRAQRLPARRGHRDVRRVGAGRGRDQPARRRWCCWGRRSSRAPARNAFLAAAVLRLLPIETVLIELGGGVRQRRQARRAAAPSAAFLPYLALDWQLPFGVRTWQASLFIERQLDGLQIAGVRISWDMGSTLSDLVRRTGWRRLR